MLGNMTVLIYFVKQQQKSLPWELCSFGMYPRNQPLSNSKVFARIYEV